MKVPKDNWALLEVTVTQLELGREERSQTDIVHRTGYCNIAHIQCDN